MKNRNTSRFYTIILIAFAANFLFSCNQEKREVDDPFKHEESPDGYNDFFKRITVPIGDQESGYSPGYRLNELKDLKKHRAILKSFSDTLIFYPRGPYNIGGRTRAIIVDPDDATYNTIYAGTAGGGIWKTTDGGKTWLDLTPDLPNISTVAMTMAESNHDIIYVGTGEGYGGVGMITGDGMFKTQNRGTSWNRLESTVGEDFNYINKIWVHPSNPDILIAATNTGLYKSINGGDTWVNNYKSTYSVQDIQQNPKDPDVLYASVNSYGIIKSYNGGETWKSINNGIAGVGRISISVSPVDTSYVFATAEGQSGDMDIYISSDAGENWRKNGPDSEFINFQGSQGWYNNTIIADPFVREKVYVGGVYLGSLTFQDSVFESKPSILRVDTIGTGHFLDFINFGGTYLGGGMTSGLDEDADVSKSDFVSVELRFGPGLKQYAHRFMVPEGEGPGVAKEDYTYYDYVEVPFQVWDVTNNRQLMVSFRDQERDGKFNLILRNPNDENLGREYIFVNSVTYNPGGPDINIAKAGGHYYKMLYFFWPTLAINGDWNPDSLEESKIKIDYGTQQIQAASTEIISNDTKNKNLHVDHHQLILIPGKDANDNIRMISANDGGVAISGNSGKFWEQLTNGFYTTQFYGVAKKPGGDVFIGGMQDNGTWMSPVDKNANDAVDYVKMLGGDGFEVLWHPTDKKRIIASIYNNIFYWTNDGGTSWQRADYGLNQEGPFISKLSNSVQNPELVFTVDAKGVYKHTDFAKPPTYWKLTKIEKGLAYNGVATSAIDVEVSKADPSIIWAGQGMYEDPYLDIFISENKGTTFDSVAKYKDVKLGFTSGIATHPSDPNTAYLLFSYKAKPKILRTTDKGKSWEDITGYGTNSVSSNGFPDVVVLCLLVMPHDNDVIWVGTEIGIVESTDNGNSWHVLSGDFPNVAVYQLQYQDNMIIIATHGRGLWTAGNRKVDVPESKATLLESRIFPNPVQTDLSIMITGAEPGLLRMKLYKSTGQLVQIEEREILEPDHVYNMNIADQLPGNYYLVLQSDQLYSTEKLLIY